MGVEKDALSWPDWGGGAGGGWTGRDGRCVGCACAAAKDKREDLGTLFIVSEDTECTIVGVGCVADSAADLSMLWRSMGV